MSTESVADSFRARRLASAPLFYGAVPKVRIPRSLVKGIAITWLVTCFGGSWVFNRIGIPISEKGAELMAWFTIITLFSIPLWRWVYACIRTRTILAREFVDSFSPLARFWYSVVLAFLLLIPVRAVLPVSFFLFRGPFHFLLPFLGGAILYHYLDWKGRRDLPYRPAPRRSSSGDSPFGLFLGTSTGQLSTLSHGAGLAPGQNVTLSLDDACQNILVLGGIGSGKTTRAVQPLLVQLLDLGAGGLLFDVKGDFGNATLTLAEEAGRRHVTVIGPGRTRMNLLSGLTPEVAASFLKSALLVNGRGQSDPFWMDTAAELSRNSLGVLSFFPARYSLTSLHEYLFNSDVKSHVTEEAHELLPSLEERDARLLTSYLSYDETIFSAFDDKVRSGVMASVAQVLAPFNHPDLVDAFSTDDVLAPRMEDVVNGAVYLVDMPLSRWGLGGKVAYTFLKLRFFNVMERRRVEPEWDRERPVFFMCDEFQEIVSANRDGLSDLNFWDKSRSSKCIGIVSAQGVNSFYAAIGRKDVADALLQNFRQKVCFRTEDTATLELMNYLLGRVDVDIISHQESKTDASRGGSKTRGFSVSSQERAVLNPQAFRQMGQNEALCLLSVSGRSMDDMIETIPVFVDA